MQAYNRLGSSFETAWIVRSVGKPDTEAASRVERSERQGRFLHWEKSPGCHLNLPDYLLIEAFDKFPMANERIRFRVG
jgi:hypothetical protein